MKTIADAMPLVRIGMRVYNGEKYMRQALDSLLAQEFRDFEVIISDNASTDATRDLCLDYASRNLRIRFYRNEKKSGCNKEF